jgi:hypothetical protein
MFEHFLQHTHFCLSFKQTSAQSKRQLKRKFSLVLSVKTSAFEYSSHLPARLRTSAAVHKI